jgi:hypothetical protein
VGDLGLNWCQTGVKLGSSWGQAGGQPVVNLRSTWGKPEVNMGSSWGQPEVKLGSTWGQPGVNLHRPAWGYKDVADGQLALERGPRVGQALLSDARFVT